MSGDETLSRHAFNAGPAAVVAQRLGITKRSSAGKSARFEYFEDDDRFLVVAGPSEAPDVDLALAYGLTWAGSKRLMLALPVGCTTATAQRLPWLSEERRPELHEHGIDGQVQLARSLSRADSLAAVRAQEPRDVRSRSLLSPTDGADSTVPAIAQLVRLATRCDLQAAHRLGRRSWHCRGLQVLSAETTRTQLTVRAGVHHSVLDRHPWAVAGPVAAPLEQHDLDALEACVRAAVDERLRGPEDSLHRPDEHWLQSVIRQQPSLAGLKGEAHREVAAWRPRDGAAWARGFIDLVGVGEDGNIRVVETKLSANEDTRFVFQALDYYIWAMAHREPLAAASGLPADADIDLSLLVGAGTDGRLALSRYSQGVAKALAKDIRWTFVSVTDWFEGEPKAEAQPPQTVPTSWSNAGRPTGNAYVDVARAVAERWKASSPTIEPAARRPGPYRITTGGAVYDFCLPLEHATLNLLPEVRERALAAFATDRIAWHASVRGGPTTHLLSSQVQCVNALGQMVNDPARLKAAFTSVLDIGSIDLVNASHLTFEWVPAKDHLNESLTGKLRRGAGNTSVDAAFRFTTLQGASALALVEWKFTESYTRARRANASSDEIRRSRYLRLVRDPSGPIDPDLLPFEDLLDEPFYQLVRQQLLAHALEADVDEQADEVHVVHVVPPSNVAYQQSLVRDSHRQVGDSVDAVWTGLNRRPDRYHRLDPAVFLDPAITSADYVSRYTIP